MSKIIEMKPKPLNEEEFIPSEKRIFIILLVLSCAFLLGLAWLIWWVPYVGLANINRYLPWIFGICLGLIVLYGIFGAITLLLTIVKRKNFFFDKRLRGVVIKLIFPLLVLVGKLFGISADKVRRSFVAVNNELVMAEARRIRPEKLLVLLPHCLQNHECGVRIIWDIKNCKRCGKCKIKYLLELAEKYNVPISVATGGTLARKVVKENRPDAIVAVACERDLTSGIQDTYPIPVFGILNKRPNGPCYDTDVDLDMVKKGIEFFLGYEPKEESKSEKSRPVDTEQA